MDVGRDSQEKYWLHWQHWAMRKDHVLKGTWWTHLVDTELFHMHRHRNREMRKVHLPEAPMTRAPPAQGAHKFKITVELFPYWKLEPYPICPAHFSPMFNPQVHFACEPRWSFVVLFQRVPGAQNLSKLWLYIFSVQKAFPRFYLGASVCVYIFVEDHGN